MKFIADLKEGERVADIYLCKSLTHATTKNGKPYDSVLLQDKTGTIDAKIWEVTGAGIEDFEPLDFVMIGGEVTSFGGALQINVRRARKAYEKEYEPENYLPVSERNPEEMWQELLAHIGTVKNPHLNALLKAFFVDDAAFIAKFKKSSAAKNVHHNFIGGLLEHTLGVAVLCDFFAARYPMLKRDLLFSSALLHDIGKVKELSDFPMNDYTDDGNFLGHIYIGCEMIAEKLSAMPDFPPLLATQLKHCILAHHGEYEFGSPKKPELAEALALHFADNMDAKMETLKELFEHSQGDGFLGWQKLFESNMAKTRL